jgi:hypothetical protein
VLNSHVDATITLRSTTPVRHRQGPDLLHIYYMHCRDLRCTGTKYRSEWGRWRGR